MLEQLLAPIDDTSASGLTSWLQRLEAQDATGFTALRNWVYYGYYTSGSVAEALRHTSSDFHGAPQPFGWEFGISREWSFDPNIRRLDQDYPVTGDGFHPFLFNAVGGSSNH